MKHKLLLFLVLLCTAACQIDYDGETRYVVKVHAVDQDGNPANNAPVQITVSDNNVSDIISVGKTDEAGNGTFVFPAPKYDTARILVEVASNNENYVGDAHSFTQADFADYQIDINATLYRTDAITVFTLNKNHVNANTTLTALSLDAQTIEEYGQDNIFYITDFFVLKNQTITLHYTVKNNDTLEENSFSIPIVIGTQQVTYNLNY